MFSIVILSILSLLLSFFVKRDPDSIAFGAWCGELYADNSKYLAQYINDNYPDKKIYWVGTNEIRDRLPERFIFVPLNSFSSIFILSKVKYFFFTQMHRADICKYNVYRKAKLCYLDHGYGVKKWGADDPTYDGKVLSQNFLFRLYHSIIGESIKYDYIISPSENMSAVLRTALKYKISDKTELILTGSPRDDFLVHADKECIRECKRKLAETYGYSSEKTIVSYLPTFRRKTKKIESLVNRDIDEIRRLEKILNRHNAVLLEKNHFAANKYSENLNGSLGESLVKVDKPGDFQELLLATDIQIGDYSGGCLDFLILNRPIIYYMYDYNEYKNFDSGLYWDADTFAAGKIVSTFDDLLIALEESLSMVDEYEEKRKKVKDFFMSYEDGHCCERICKVIFSDSK